MKVEITDRQKWLEKVDIVIQKIMDERKKRDMKNVAQWRNHIFSWVRKNRATKFPDPYEVAFHYPSEYQWKVLGTLQKVKVGLDSVDTGTVYLSDDEIYMIDINQE